MEKLRKNAQEFILITLLKLITVDEMGIDELEEEEQLSFHGIFCNIYLGVGVPMMVKRKETDKLEIFP